MFHLIKKDKEKDRDKEKEKEKEKDGGRKKEKKEKKERMSAAELLSLEEMSLRRGFFNLNRSSKRESRDSREPRGRLQISNPIPIKVASGSDLTLGDIEPDADDAGDRGSALLDAGGRASPAPPTTREGRGRGGARRAAGASRQDRGQAGQAASLARRSKGRRKARAGRVPEVVDKTFPADLRLPALVAAAMPEPRDLELQRRNTGDFGFSLRRTTMLDRGADGAPYRRAVHFAEPGAGTKDLALGLVPGDRLVEINGQNVESRTRDEIVEMIRRSGDAVRLKVQPILELSELSRCWLRACEGQRREAYDVPVWACGPPCPGGGAVPGSTRAARGRAWSGAERRDGVITSAGALALGHARGARPRGAGHGVKGQVATETETQ
ncbi:hypothetical protein ANANG_G00232050 [Anguilla anguilla]|uniref:PDZ domain-containing protein n=1 Tax=Anguilla anguilla TaxID=7936 RepID=A0A9D3LTJ4_ANGAN|nr:hypothetical protein ANANG_G00232050 [Anguilla anguilla]